MLISEKQAVTEIMESLGVDEKEATKIYAEQIEEFNKIQEALKFIPDLKKQIFEIKKSMRNLFAIMDEMIPGKILKSEAYQTAKTLIQENGSN